MSAQGGQRQRPVRDRAKAIYRRTQFLKIKQIFALVRSQKKGRGQVLQRHAFPKGPRRNIIEGMEGKCKRDKALIFIVWLWPSGTGRWSKWDLNRGNQSLIAGPAGPRAARGLGVSPVRRDSFCHILFLGLRWTVPNRLPCQVRKLHFWSCH